MLNTVGTNELHNNTVKLIFIGVIYKYERDMIEEIRLSTDTHADCIRYRKILAEIGPLSQGLVMIYEAASGRLLARLNKKSR